MGVIISVWEARLGDRRRLICRLVLERVVNRRSMTWGGGGSGPWVLRRGEFRRGSLVFSGELVRAVGISMFRRLNLGERRASGVCCYIFWYLT